MKTVKYLSLFFALIFGMLSFPMLAGADSNSKYSDVIIKTKIMTVYTVNPNLNPFNLDVTVKNGNVVLGGTVASGAEKDLAYEIAKGVDGVTDVTNNIKTEKNVKKRAIPAFAQTVTDASTTATIKSKLLMNNNTSGLSIHVKTVNGVVALEGKVDSDAEKQLAEQIASNTNDVTKVDNNLEVQNRS